MLANGVALEIEGCREKKPLQSWEVRPISLLLLPFSVNPIKGYWLPVDNRTATFRSPSQSLVIPHELVGIPCRASVVNKELADLFELRGARSALV